MPTILSLTIRLMIGLLFIVPMAVQAQDVTPEATPLLSPTGFSISVTNVQAPTECSAGGWVIVYDRTTTFGSIDRSTLARYSVRYLDDDLYAVSDEVPGSDYIADYWATSGSTVPFERVGSGYTPLWWSNNYHAAAIEYVLQGDAVIWALRAALTCENGAVVDYEITSEPVENMTRDALPTIELHRQNLVLALEDFVMHEYGTNPNPGTIRACQTFFISDLQQNRASILLTARQSITGTRIYLFDGTWVPVVDVAEDYGQPGGQPIIAACAGATATAEATPE
jgi:hypothetical protein